MIAEIVSVGTELLMGQVVNTDAQFIARSIAPLGYQVFYHITVGDNVKRLTEVVKTSLSRADVVIFTGGLGPTDDDLTKETVAAALNQSCVPIPAEVERLTRHFSEKGRVMTPNNIKQACFPVDAVILPNPNGTAPGCIMISGDKAAVLLPGPPRELMPMFTNYVMPYLEKRSGMKLFSRELRIFGMGESDVTYRLSDLIEHQTNPTLAPYVKTGEVTLRVTARCESDAEGERLAAPMIAEIQSRLGDVLFDTNGHSLPEVCASALLAQRATLAVAESLTGGLLASAFIDIPGSSAFFLEGAVTYSNASKAQRLSVSESTLQTSGAVSAACAREMAEGVRRASNADYALSTTGIAGPAGGTEKKPVGLVYIALADRDGVDVKELKLFGDRARIRHTAVLNACDMLRRKLLQ